MCKGGTVYHMLMRICLWVGLVLTPAVGWAAVAVDDCTIFDSPAAANDHDVTTLTVGATANYLLVFVQSENSANTFTVNWDDTGTPQAMSSIATNSVGALKGEAFELVNPTAGNLTLEVTSSNTNCCSIIACSFTGVNTSDPTDTPIEDEQTGSTTGTSVAFTLNAGGMAVSFLGSQGPAWAGFNAQPAGAGGTQTQREIDTDGCVGSSNDCQVSLYTGDTSPFAYTWNNSSVDFWHVVIPVNAASTRRPIPPMILQ